MVGEMANDVEGLDPLAPADENRLADIAAAGPSISTTANSRGCTLFSLGLCLAGRYGRSTRAAILPVAGVDAWGESKLAQADKHTNAGSCASGLIITARKW